MKRRAQKAKAAAKYMKLLESNTRNSLLLKLAHEIRIRKEDILRAQAMDAKQGDLSYPFMTRTDLESMALAIETMSQEEDLLGEIPGQLYSENSNRKIKRYRVPKGVILVIFSHQTKVMIEAVTLALKTSNVLILKAFSELNFTSELIKEIIEEVIQDELPKEAFQVMFGENIDDINELLTLSTLIDMVIPVGETNLVSHVIKHARMPSLVQYKELSHVFIDKSAKLEDVKNIIIKSSLQSLLIHHDIVEHIGLEVYQLLQAHHRLIQADSLFYALTKLTPYYEGDPGQWGALFVKAVGNVDEALEFFEEVNVDQKPLGIISQDQENIQKFVVETNAPCVMINTSSNSAYGEMGITPDQLITQREIVIKCQRNDVHARNETNLV